MDSCSRGLYFTPPPPPPPHPQLPFINPFTSLHILSSHRLPPVHHPLPPPSSLYISVLSKTIKSKMESTTTRRPYFVEENNGLASISDLEHGFSSSSPSSSMEDNHHHHHMISRPIYSPRKASIRNLSFSRSGRFFHGRFEEQPQPHFLDACFLCKKPLGPNRDIFMYRGDTPFCSEECRAEQIDIDESKEKNKNLSASMKALRKKEQSETSPNKNSKKYPFHSGAVAAA
ncbi:hypothetical protein L6452_31528 [Arctium lappa]|uniref:Uncharacterized protein n=1 Tax=Arctium lappa TaxID=4217 RepID=A0ACB8Z2P0_ARCLA|nr:hypothetical protein L6452_31528 [Arctium lappa]